MSEGGGKGKKDGSSSAKGKKDGDKKPASKSGFQTLGLPKELLRGILNMGYKVPTPVQRKTLPLALAGQDLVCMARTGSGKTAAFLVPLMVHLGCEHRPRGKVRAVVLSPTRELAIQTLRFARQMAKYTSLRAALVVGGDGMDEQFEALAACPDVLIATPGRLAHHLDEVPDFTLDGTEFVVFDEADRLFEMGFADELRRLMNAMPEQRQCLLFSATMPKALVTFARAGLNDPQLVRLDTDTKVSENLRLAFLTCRSKDKPGAFLFTMRELLQHDTGAAMNDRTQLAELASGGLGSEKKGKQKGVKGGGKGGGKGKDSQSSANGGKPAPLTVVFVATRHHCEFLHSLCSAVGLSATVVYGTMDQEARKLHLDRFRKRQVPILIVTDVAARGIDIPLLDHVVNYSFPPNPKLFVHRVGRTARQGKAGLAVSLVEPDELPFMVDLHLYLGHPLQDVYHGASADPKNLPGSDVSAAATAMLTSSNRASDEAGAKVAAAKTAAVAATTLPGCYSVSEMTPEMAHFGALPQHLLDSEAGSVRGALARDHTGNLENLARVCENAMKQYKRTRPDPSAASIRRAKLLETHRIHPLLLYRERALQSQSHGNDKSGSGGGIQGVDASAAVAFLHSLGSFRPKQTVFETDSVSSSLAKQSGFDVMAGVRKAHRVAGALSKHTVSLQQEVQDVRTAKEKRDAEFQESLKLLQEDGAEHKDGEGGMDEDGEKGSSGDDDDDDHDDDEIAMEGVAEDNLSEEELTRGHNGSGGGRKNEDDDEDEDNEDEDVKSVVGRGRSGDGNNNENNDDGWDALQAGLAEDAAAAAAAAASSSSSSSSARPVKRLKALSAVGGEAGTAAVVAAKIAAASLFNNTGNGGVSSSSSGAGDGSGGNTGSGKRRLSAHERKRMAKGLPAKDPLKEAEEAADLADLTAARAQSNGSSGGGCKSADYGSTGRAREEFSFGSGAYRDPAAYIGYGRTVGEAEREAFDPNAEEASKGGLEKLVAGRLEDGLLDITGDEASDQRRQTKVHQWDKRKKKYVTTTLGELADEGKTRGKAKVRTESGLHSLSRKSKDSIGDVYAKWQAKTKKSIGGNAYTESASNTTSGGGSSGDSSGGNASGSSSLADRMPLPKTKKERYAVATAKKQTNTAAHATAKGELKGAKAIKEERKKKDDLKVKNLPKDKRRHVLEKRKHEWKAKVARKEEEVRVASFMGGQLGHSQGGGKNGGGKKRKR